MTRRPAIAPAGAVRASRAAILDIGGVLLTLLTVVCAVIWVFPLYWAMVTSFKPEDEVVRPEHRLWPDTFTLEAYIYILTNTELGTWYLNSIITSVGDHRARRVHGRVLRLCHLAAPLPRPALLWWLILASFMVPIQALIVNHFMFMAGVKLLNTLARHHPAAADRPGDLIVYKQFFDSVPREFREAAVIDGANEFQLLFRIFLPMNWGVTTALAIITFIGAWNAFLWPFLAQDRGHDERDGRHHPGAGRLRRPVCPRPRRRRACRPAGRARLPIFQRRVTQAITLSAGIKG